MDSITQGLLGATIGQTFFGHKLGGRAAIWGAVAGIVPDLDFVAAGIAGPFGEMVTHRGTSHALWFAPLLALPLSFAVWRIQRWKHAHEFGGAGKRSPGTFGTWFMLFLLAIITHPLLDIFTSYGTQLFAPFSRHRYALHGVSIVDPVYSLILVFALLLGTRFGKHPIVGTIAGATALVLTTSYLFYGTALNQRAKAIAKADLEQQHHEVRHIEAYPTFFQVYQRRIVARTRDRIFVGDLTLWPDTPHLRWASYTPPDNTLIGKTLNTNKGRIFKWFSANELAPQIEPTKDGYTAVTIDDLRYGFIESKLKGIWGIRAIYDKEGRLVGEIERYQHRFPAPFSVMLRNLLTDTFDPSPNNVAEEKIG